MHSTCLIQPRDFIRTTTDVNYAANRWHAGHLRLVVEALKGTRVAIVTDNQTGHMPVGVKLVRVDPRGHGEYPRLVVEYPHGENCTVATGVQAACGAGCPGYHRTAHLVFNIGVIVPMDASNAKWDATKAFYERSGRVVEAARAEWEPEGCTYGKFTATPLAQRDLWHVTYEPQREGAGTRRWGSFPSTVSTDVEPVGSNGS